MGFAIYYIMALGSVVLAWPCVVGSRVSWHLFWGGVWFAALSFPLWLPVRLAFYYGLLVNVSLLFWSADTFTGRSAKRWRGIVGGVLLAPVPVFVSALQENWVAAILTPTVGHMVVSGMSWPVVVWLLAKAVGAREEGD